MQNLSLVSLSFSGLSLTTSSLGDSLLSSDLAASGHIPGLLRRKSR